MLILDGRSRGEPCCCCCCCVEVEGDDGDVCRKCCSTCGTCDRSGGGAVGLLCARFLLLKVKDMIYRYKIIGWLTRCRVYTLYASYATVRIGQGIHNITSSVLRFYIVYSSNLTIYIYI